MFSSGAGSWAAAKRVAAQCGTDDLVLLFADTLIEDEDNYRFLHEASANVGGQLVTVCEGRTPWEVFFDVRFIGNTRVDPCSRVLKREPLRRWLNQNCDPADTIVYIGIGWDEKHRLRPIRAAHDGWRVEAPMCDEPHLFKADVLRWIREEGIEPPRLYQAGFPHANCGGTCVKAGQAWWRLLLLTDRNRYLEWELNESRFRSCINPDVSILRDRRGGETNPITLRQLRERIESGAQVDLFDWGGCGCLVGEDTT